ncbi:hypothetical protein Bca4012_010268 [Brassica carinata]
MFCNGENMDGKCVHVDDVNGMIDAEQNVEAASAVCKMFLRYVVAFAGGGAKYVTRCSSFGMRSTVEDIELATRALTEPLPANQQVDMMYSFQANKGHELYAIEKLLHKNQILNPKGPVLGFCFGHSVYPRTCVQTLRTKESWRRDKFP